MAQATLYLDDDTRRRLEEAARRAGLSISQWVKQRISRSLDSEWPEGYFDEVIGVLEENDLHRLPEPSFQNDAPRAGL